MTAPVVSVERVSHRFGQAPVLADINLAIAPGSYTVLLGPSGSGKTTLLSILGGFLEPTQGRVVIDGRDCTSVPPRARPTATVFQDYALFPHLSVASNVAFGLMIAGRPKPEREAEARKALKLVGLEAAFDRKPHQLSGGQRQRVALARALAVKPAVLLLDEPLGALDLKLRRQMQDELKAIQREVGTAFVHVTHDQEEAMALADIVVLMNQGRIDDRGPPERVYLKPRSRFGAAFMGESTILQGKARGDALETPLGRLPLEPGTPDGPAAVCLRPEDVLLERADAALPLGPATVESVVFQGSFKRVVARPLAEPGTSIIIRAPRDLAVDAGAKADLFCRPRPLAPLQET
jgi:spermidine/putrescine transport system ATP-binding protein